MNETYGDYTLLATVGFAGSLIFRTRFALILPIVAGLVLAFIWESRPVDPARHWGGPWVLTIGWFLLLALIAMPWAFAGRWIRGRLIG